YAPLSGVLGHELIAAPFGTVNSPPAPRHRSSADTDQTTERPHCHDGQTPTEPIRRLSHRLPRRRLVSVGPQGYVEFDDDSAHQRDAQRLVTNVPTGQRVNGSIVAVEQVTVLQMNTA